MELSKSRYTRGLQCVKMLWLEEHRPEERTEDQASSGALAQGTEVGELARGYFGPHVLVGTGVKGLRAMVEQTRVLMDGHAPVLCEAAFEVNGNLCLVDILRRTKDGWDLIEVKSSLSRDDKTGAAKRVQMDDLAFQYFVLQSAGVPVRSAQLLRINPTYVRAGDIDIHQLFVIKDFTAQVESMQPAVAREIARLTTSAEQEKEPSVNIGRQCDEPYRCSFHEYCWRDVPTFSVFDLFNKDVAAQHHAAGVTTAADVLAEQIEVPASKKLRLSFETSDRAPQIDSESISAFLDQKISYPVSFLDFETFFTEAVPRWDGIKPYQQIVFQYSLHIQTGPATDPQHREFLAPLGNNPRRAVAEKLVADIPAKGTVLAWNKSFEIGRIRELAADYEDLAAQLLAINERIADLGEPFKAKHYYDRAFLGSWSLKYVVPALFPGDPSLDYSVLDGIHNGGDASETYRTLHLVDDVREQERIRLALLAYCRLDTYATVKILDFLQEVSARQSENTGVVSAEIH